MGLGIVLVWNIGYGMIMTSKFLCALGGVGWHGYGAPWHWGGSGFFIDRSPWHWGRALIANPWKEHHHPDIEEISTTLLVDHDVVGWSKWSYKIGFRMFRMWGMEAGVLGYFRQMPGAGGGKTLCQLSKIPLLYIYITKHQSINLIVISDIHYKCILTGKACWKNYPIPICKLSEPPRGLEN